MPLGALLALLLASVAPLFAGGVTPVGILIVELSAFTAAIAATFAGHGVAVPAKRIALLIAGLAAIGVVQWVPLPETLVRLLSPASADVWSSSALALRAAGSEAPLMRISIAPTQTANGVLITAALAAVVWAAACLPSRWVAEAFIVSGLIQVIWKTFVISNHDAAFLLLPLSVALAIGRTASGIQRRWSIAAAAVFGASIIAAGSRAGIAAGVIAVAFVLTPGSRRRALAMTAVSAFAAATIAALAIGDVRVQLWRQALEAWKQFPLLGSGLGSFADAFGLAGAPAGTGIVAHAHNGFLQLAVTTGLAGAALAGAAAATIVFARYPRTTLGLAAAGSTVALALHSAVDFGLSLPAIAASYLCLIGAALRAEEPIEPEVDRAV